MKEVGLESQTLFVEVLKHADDNLVIAHRLSEWVASAPDLETDIAIANIALDHLGVARALLAHAAQLEGRGRNEDDLAMLRSEREFSNLLLCELPNGDFAQTLARQFLFDGYQLGLWELLAAHPDPTLAGVARKALMEARYHFRFSSSWVARLGDGTEESHRRMEAALGVTWQFVDEMFEEHPGMRPGWDHLVDPVLADATLDRPPAGDQRHGGRLGIHGESLGHLLAEMQSVARSHPGGAMVTAAISPVSLVGSVRDPEIPALAIGDLGIVRSVAVEGNRVSVTIIPTYSGCPAMDAIRSDIAAVLADNGYECDITTTYTPAWTTDMITARGRQALIETGIAPPTELIAASCPQCGTPAPRVVSEFGSTACKALMVCSSCREPFDLFKEHR